MRKLVINFQKKKILFVWVFICLFEPVKWTGNFNLHLLAQWTVIVLAVVLGGKAIVNYRKIERMTKWTMAYGLSIVLSSFVNSSLSIAVVRIVLSLVCVGLIFDFYSFAYIRISFLYAMAILVISNFLLHIGNTEEWFLTGSNALIIYLLPALIISIASIEQNKNVFISWLVIIICGITAMLSDTATLIFCIYSILILWVIFRIISFNFFKTRTIITAIVALFFIVVVFNMQNNIFLIKYVIEDILKRDITFTSRTIVWAEAFNQIKQAFILGHGYGYSFHVGESGMGFWVEHAHNHYLQQFIQGGVIQFIFFSLIIFEVIKTLRNCNSRNTEWINIAILVIGIMFLVESYTSALIQSIFCIIYHYCSEIAILSKNGQKQKELCEVK